MGAKGSTINWPDTPQAISQGMVDGVTVPISALYPSKLYETTSEITFIPFQWFFHSTVVNEEKWNDLPEDVQDVLIESVREAEEWQLEDVDKLNEKVVEGMKSDGVEIKTISDQDNVTLKEQVKSEEHTSELQSRFD